MPKGSKRYAERKYKKIKKNNKKIDKAKNKKAKQQSLSILEFLTNYGEEDVLVEKCLAWYITFEILLC